MSTSLDITIPKAFLPLFKPSRYKVYYGGRGGAKSHTIARYLLVEGMGSKHRILCTRELFDNWQDYKAGKVLETSFAREDTDFEQGLYMNTPIYPIDIWSDMIQSDFDNGTTYYLPNRALLTTVENLAVGFDTFEGAAGFNDAYLDKTTELYNIKSLFKIDAKIIEEFMCSVAY